MRRVGSRWDCLCHGLILQPIPNPTLGSAGACPARLHISPANHRTTLVIRILLLLLSLSLTPGSAAPVSREDPEQADTNKQTMSTAAGSAVVVTANPLASKAALGVLASGGHAVDALVAAQAVLAVVEPQSSGLGGGGFLLHWDARRQALEVFDGRETAPARSRSDDLLQPSGEPLSYRAATRHPHAIGVPGTVALLWEAHQQLGQRPWSSTLTPAIRLARDGFLPSPRLRRSVALAQRLGASHNHAFQQLYLPGGTPLPAGRLFRNPALARTLEVLAQEGGRAFYQGPLAQRIQRGVNALQSQEPGFKGWTAADLASYSVVRRAPLCRVQMKHRVCTVPPPSSGGLAVLQTLALLDATGSFDDPSNPQSWRHLVLAESWADADRLYWVHDPIDGTIPTQGLLDPAYIRARVQAMQASPERVAQPGLPPGMKRFPFGRPGPGTELGTSHVTIVDGRGNLASYTTTVETVFGSRNLVEGMVMNNQLTDFDWRPVVGGLPVANRRRPGRRPVSSMAPTIVFNGDQPVLALGSPGGKRIPHYISRVLLAALPWAEPPARSVGLPLVSPQGITLVIERKPPLPWPVNPNELNAPGRELRLQTLGSGIGLVQRIGNRWHGAADPRREGTALALP